MQQTTAPRARFSLGRIVATPGALDALAEAGVSPRALLARHQSRARSASSASYFATAASPCRAILRLWNRPNTLSA